jgi:RNA polymerase sigma factor (TIGR02999 family)
MNHPSDHTVTEVLDAIERGDAAAHERLLPLVYDELRRLAHAKMAGEPAGLTLQPTALVHEAYLRLLGEGDPHWKNRAHFFAAAAEAMRRILIERARRAGRIKHGGGRRRLSLDDADIADPERSVDILALDEVLTRLRGHDPRLERVVLLRFYAGLSVEHIAEMSGTSPRTVKRDWEFARAWLFDQLSSPDA